MFFFYIITASFKRLGRIRIQATNAHITTIGNACGVQPQKWRIEVEEFSICSVEVHTSPFIATEKRT